MRDVDLWHSLTCGDRARPADLLAELRALVDRPAFVRAPLAGAMCHLCGHAEAAIRAAAVSVLAGSTGIDGLGAIVLALGDAEPEVAAAAVAALVESARHVPTRIVHALFHPARSVRLAAAGATLPHDAAPLAAYLRGDPDPDVRELAARAPWPRDSLPLALHLFARGRTAARDLLSLLFDAPDEAVLALLEREVGRSPIQCGLVLEQASSATAPERADGSDVFDVIGGALAQAPAWQQRVLDVLVEVALGKGSRELPRRLLVSIVSGAAGRDLSAPEIGAAVALEPMVIGWPWFRRDMAAAAAAGLRRHRHGVRSLPAVTLIKLLGLDVMITADGGPDLDLATALVALGVTRRVQRLVDRFGEPAILDALVRSSAGWYGICLLPEESRAPTWYWVDVVKNRDRRRGAEMTAISIALWPGARGNHVIDPLRDTDRAEALAALVDLWLASVLSPDQVTTVCSRLAATGDASSDADALAGIVAPLESAAPGSRSIVDRREHPVAWQVAFELARALTAERFAAALLAQSDERLRAWAVQLAPESRLPWSHELAAAHALSRSHVTPIAAWASTVLVDLAAPSVRSARPAPPPVRSLDPAESDAIASAAEADLELALAPALAAPCRGLCGALARRADPRAPNLATCLALVGCADPLADVARELDRWSRDSLALVDALDTAACATWCYNAAISPLGHAVLFRWERHNFALADWIASIDGGLVACLRDADAIGGTLARWLMWRGAGEVVTVWRYRDRPRLAAEVTPALIDLICDQFDTVVGEPAARILVAAVTERLAGDLAPIRSRVLARAAEASPATRALLDRVVRLDGLPLTAGRADDAGAHADLADIARSDDLDLLVRTCGSARRRHVAAAVDRLIDLGDAGQRRLANLLAQLDRLPVGRPIADSVARWTDPVALDSARDAARTAAAGWRFAICLALDWTDEALVLAGQAWPARWIERSDWDRLVALAGDRRCALALAGSPHHHAYLPAIDWLLAAGGDDDEIRRALGAFLRASCDRPLELRRESARALLERWGDPTGLPIAIEEALAPGSTERRFAVDQVAPASRAAVVRDMVELAFAAGPAACDESRLLELVRAATLDPTARADAMSRIVRSAMNAAVRRIAAASLSAGSGASLAAIAPVFAWGVRRGRELTGRLFRIHMTGGERELGHTYMSEARVFVSPLPLLRGEPHARDIVEGLILHELGHHRYHHAPDDAEVWKRARAEGLGPLLNLVADEHLERNLRAIDPEYGDRLKRLAAYAFLHGAQEIAVEPLLASLGAWAVDGLTATPLEVAFDPASVKIARGAVLGQLEDAGHPLARFIRALRLGLGERRGDPVIARALALFGRSFRKLDMVGLYGVTRQIADLMGGAVGVAQVFGGSEGITWSERDGDLFGAGLDDDILQREVERILDPRGGARAGGRSGKPERLAINVGPDREFDRISHIVRVAGDPARHRELASSVNRHAIRLRSLLQRLGLRWEPVGARMRGRAIDRTRIPALVTRADPRILTARRALRRNDLFLGVAIDCSGSMSAGDNLARAQRFGILIAEAVRELPGVDARFVGFTDATIYDAGDADHCGVTALETGAGNNDAAALYHVARLALRSRRKSKVVVMISDGLPTECSVAALRGLVDELTRRRGIVCAQVAVRPLEEICFPHHVVIDDAGLDVSVARFGRMIGDLVRRTLLG